jgi:hypothetical protein
MSKRASLKAEHEFVEKSLANRDNPRTLFDESRIPDNEMLRLCQYVVLLHSGTNLIIADVISSDPYCEVSVQGMVRTSKIIKKELNPIWDEVFCFYTELPENIKFKVWDFDNIGKNDPMGEAEFDSRELFDMLDSHKPEGIVFEGELKLSGVKHGALHVKIKCRTMTPIKTEKLLDECERQLKEIKGNLEVETRQNEEKKKVLEMLKHDEKRLEKEVDQLNSIVKQFEQSEKDFKAKILALQKQIQEKDAQLAKFQDEEPIEIGNPESSSKKCCTIS